MKEYIEREISIIIPTYKPQDYIVQCLDSINDQNLDKKRFEILLVLNGPSDPYETYLTSLIEERYQTLNINYIYNKESGVSKARNIGMENSTGKYITFIDDDDFISPNYLSGMLSLVKKGYFPITNLLVYNDITNKLESNYISRCFNRNIDKESISLYNVRSYFSTPYCKLIAKSDIGERSFDEKFTNGEDALFMASISDKVSKVKLTSSDVLYYRRQRVNSLTTRKRNRLKKILLDFKLIKEYLRFWFANPQDYNFLFMSSRIAAKFKSMFL